MGILSSCTCAEKVYIGVIQTDRLWPYPSVRPELFPSSPGQGPNGARAQRIGEG